MNECPEIDGLLSATGRSRFASHLSACEACRAVAALAEVRAERTTSRDDACGAAEVSIALAQAGVLAPAARAELTLHLEGCAVCGEVFARVGAMPTSREEATSTGTAPAAFAVTQRSGRPFALGALALAACLLVALGVALVSKRGPPRRAEQASAEPEPAPPVSVVLPPAMPSETESVAGSAPAKRALDDSVAAAGFLSITCTPGCRVLEAGRLLGRAPLSGVALAPGTHELTLVDRAQRKLLSVEVVAGQTVARHVAMSPGAKAKDEVVDPWAAPSSAGSAEPKGVVDPWARGTGYLTIACTPACDSVRAGGRELGPSPVVRAPLAVGTVAVALRRGSVAKQLSVRIEAGQVAALRIDMRSNPDPGY